MASNAPPLPPAQSNLEIIIRKYIPKELIPPTWKCEKFDDTEQTYEAEKEELKIANIRSLFDEGQPQLGMFSSSDELNMDIGRYFSFSKGMEYFNLDPEDPFEPILYDYQTPHQQKGIYKVDLYRIYDFRASYPFEGWTYKLTDAILKDCWKNLLDDANHYEMIVCPRIPNPTEIHYQKSVAFQYPVSSNQFDKFMENWMYKYQSKINGMSDFILESLRNNYKKFSLWKRSEAISKVISYVGLVMENVAEFVKTGTINMPPLNKIKKTKPVIRVFSVGSQKVVMADELRKTCEAHGIDIGKFKKEASGMPELSTFPFDKIAAKIQNVEIVTIEKDQLLMFAQTPIPYEIGYCILAVDALYELLIDMIVAKEVFQTNEEENWIRLKQFLESMKFYFDVKRGIYFLDLGQVENIKTMWEYAYNHRLTKSLSNQKLIEENQNNGFSMEELKEILEYLDLTTCFNKIMNYVDPIYSKFPAENGGLSLSDFHLAIIRCQINCVVREVPILLEFIHKQGSCNRMNIVDCEHCEREMKELAEDLKKMEMSEEKQEDAENVTKSKNKKNKKK